MLMMMMMIMMLMMNVEGDQLKDLSSHRVLQQSRPADDQLSEITRSSRQHQVGNFSTVLLYNNSNNSNRNEYY